MSTNNGLVSTTTVATGLRTSHSVTSASSSTFGANGGQTTSAAMMMAVASVLQQLGRARRNGDNDNDLQGMHTKQGVNTSDESLRADDKDVKVQDDSHIIKAGV